MNQQLRFKKIRKYFRYTQVELGKKTNTSTETISMIERGKVKSINDNILAYLDEQGINTSWLKFGTGEMLKSESNNNSEWKEKYEKAELRAEKAEKEVSILKDTVSELRKKLNTLYEHLMIKDLKIEGLELGKDKVYLSSSFEQEEIRTGTTFVSLYSKLDTPFLAEG